MRALDAIIARCERAYLEPDDHAPAIYTCKGCCEGIRFEDTYYDIDGDIYCAACINECRSTAGEY